MSNPRIVQLIAVLACFGLIFAASTRIAPINEGRRALNTMGAASPVESTPPEYAVMIQFLGAFRALITDMAFIRAESFKEQGRFYDAMQLHKWICALQPYFPTVWEYAAWNMSWNISVTTYTPEERWNWVYNGVKLLRDQGVQLNPRAINLYKQLAWTFNNKMGEVVDDHHMTYKKNWAWRMHVLLGPPRPAMADIDPNTLAQLTQPDVRKSEDLLENAARKAWDMNEQKRAAAAAERGEAYQIRTYDQLKKPTIGDEVPVRYIIAKRAAYDRIRTIADAPERLGDVLAREPNAAQMVTALKGVGVVLNDDELTEDRYWNESGLAFRFMSPYRRLLSPTTFDRVLQAREPSQDAEGAQAEKLDQILRVRAADPAGQLLVQWFQRKVLRDVYKLDAQHMAKVVDNFGPMDWRAVDAHALYWITFGLMATGDTMSDSRNDKANTARIMFFCLRNLWQRNHMVFEPYPPAIDQSYLSLGSDLNFIEPMHQAYLRYGPYFDPRAKANEVGQAGDTFRVGHINFLTEAVWSLYLAGHESEADHYYAFLQRTYPTNEFGQVNPRLQKTLQQFVTDEFMEATAGSTGIREARAAIYQLLFRAFTELASGDTNAYVNTVRRAQYFHEQYMSNKRDDIMAPKALPEFAFMHTDALFGYLAAPVGSHYATMQKIHLWNATPLYLRQAVYDWVLPEFEAECKAFEFDLALAFPEPPDMAAFRETNPGRYRPQTEENRVVTEPMKTGAASVEEE